MDNSKQQNQSRFLIAAVLSMAFLFGWSYFFAPQKPATTMRTRRRSSARQIRRARTFNRIKRLNSTEATPDNIPNRQITIKSPLYEVKLDSKGALATSWILLKDASPKGERPLYADGSTESEKIPLQLISQKAVNEGEFRFALKPTTKI
jgi:YidC/Oxa1 family membrane protein insertase